MSDDPFGAGTPGGVNYGEFSVQLKRWVLYRVVEAVVAALPANPAMLALGCFRVRAGEGHLELAATDMERTVLAETASVVSAGPGDGTYHEAFIPAKRLQAILRELPEVDVTIAVSKNRATVTAGQGSWTLALPDGNDYPDLLSPGQLEFTSYPREKLLSALKAVRHVVGRDAGRPYLTQVAFTLPDDGPMCVTASDGARFARTWLDGFPLEMCIPLSALDHLLKLLAGGQSEDIGVSETVDALAFKVGPVVLSAAKRTIPFPDMDKLLLLPALQNEDILSVDRDELIAAVRRARINADGETSAIVLEAEAGKVTVVARDKLGNSATEAIPAMWAHAKGRTLCLSHVALIEMLDAHGTKACELRLGKDAGKRRSPVLLMGDGITQVIAQMTPSLVGY